MLGISALEFAGLAVVALLVLGPERLPRYAAQAGRYLRMVRRMAANAQEEVRRELGPEFQDISLSDLNPRTFVSKHLLDADDLSLDDDEDEDVRRRRSAKANGGGPSGATRVDLGKPTERERTGPDERPPYDADAT